jgi:flagellar biosynthesis protein FlhF
LRVFEGRTVQEAMAQLRRAMGDDAVILATEEGAGVVRLTAARDKGPDDLADILTAGTSLEVIERLAVVLRGHRVAAALIERICVAARESGSRDAEEVLAFALAAHCRFAAIGHPAGRPADRPLVVAGAPGVGKTVMVARLAAAARLAGRPVRVASTDRARRGGAAQLEALLAAMGVELEGLPAAPAAVDPACLLLVDTEAAHPLRPDALAGAAGVAQQLGAELLPVFAAETCALEAHDQALAWRALGATRHLVARLDTVRRLGLLLSVADAGLACAGAGISPFVGEPLKPLTAANLARLLLHRAASFVQEGSA